MGRRCMHAIKLCVAMAASNEAITSGVLHWLQIVVQTLGTDCAQKCLKSCGQLHMAFEAPSMESSGESHEEYHPKIFKLSG